MALQRADIGILRGGARPHRALAQVDFLELRFPGFGVELEQRALRDHRADRAFDVALGEVLSFHGLLIEHFKHAPRGVAAVARTCDGDVIAAGVGDHAETALDQREVLSVGTDQGGRGTVIVERDDDLGFVRSLGISVVLAARGEGWRIRCAFWQGFRLRWSWRTGRRATVEGGFA